MRVIGYVRVSTAEQAVSGLGLEAQRTMIRETCKARGWRLGQVFADDGVSGGTLERPALRRALEAIAAGRADGLVVAKLDRLSRSTVDTGLLLQWFKEEARAAFVALDLGVDTSTAGGELVASVMAAVAEWERNAISERTRAALAELRAQGKPTGRPAVADHPEVQERIRHLREDRGLSLQAIADQLNREGVPTIRGGTEWRKSSVSSAAGAKRKPPRRKPTALPDARSR